MDILFFVIFIVVFLYSVILHEIAHGWVANYFGDDTAKMSGRLSLNPITHIDPVGSILVPLILWFSQTGFLFGWAKPVPVNPYRLSGGPKAYRWVILAGVLTNFALAVTGAIVFKIATQYLNFGPNNLGVIFFSAMIQINLILGIFNSLPFPGFDGWNFLTTFRPFAEMIRKTPLGNPMFMARYGLLVAILLLFLFLPFIGRIFGLVLGIFTKFFGI